MKTLNKAIQVFVVVVLVISLLATSMISIDVEISANIANQHLVFQFSYDYPEAASPLYLGCCGSGNGNGGT